MILASPDRILAGREMILARPAAAGGEAEEEGVPDGPTALTIQFLDVQVTVEPKGMSVIGAAGRVELASGVKVVLLDWNRGDDWSSRWSIPSGDGGSRPCWSWGSPSRP